MSLVSRLYNVKTNLQRLWICQMIIGSQMLRLTISDFGTESPLFFSTFSRIEASQVFWVRRPVCTDAAGTWRSHWMCQCLLPTDSCLCLSVQDSWRKAVSTGVQHGIPMPCFTTALSFYDGYRHGMLPANLLQVRRPRGNIWPERVGWGEGRRERGELHRIKTVHVQLSPGCAWLAA